MSRSPILLGVLAFAAATTALHTVSGPQAPIAHESGARQSSHAATVRRIESADTGSAENSWSDSFKNDPTEEGREVAQRALRSKICAFVSCDTSKLPAGIAAGPQAAAGELVPWLTETRAAAVSPTDAMYQQPPEVILATSPDPVHTHGALLFDRSIDAIEDAFQDSGWDYQGSWMPWTTAIDKAEGATIEDTEEERLFRSGREQYPGVILFRPSASHKRTRPLLLLILGDSPTTGVVASQFREALGIFLKLSSNTEPLRILGPDYTGAEPSFYALLQHARDSNGEQLIAGRRPISVASGTVSDSHCEHVLPGIRHFDPITHNCVAGPSHFVSFGVDGEWELQQTWTFLENHGLQAENIAELSEDESGFGELLSHAPAPPRQSSAKNGEAPFDRILHLKFPRGISHLRSAYQKNAIWGFGATTGSGSMNLSLDFDEPQESNDSVQTFGQQQLAVSQEASMGQVASTLEENQIKAVLVSASDVLDELFVAQFLARRAPGVMVILRGTDNLFLGAGNRGINRNTYVISPWPLIPANATWTSAAVEAESPRSFPSGDAEGVYTATRYLLEERTDELRDYRSPADAIGSAPSSGPAPAQPGRPPLWLSVVGRGAFWPMALLNDRAPEPSIPRSEINLPGLNEKPITRIASVPASPLSQRLILIMAVVLSVLHAAKCLRLRLLERIAPWYESYETSTLRPKLALQLGISLLGIVLVCLIYEPPIGSNLRNGVWQEIPWILFLIAIAFLSLAVVDLCWQMLHTRNATSGNPRDAIIDPRVLAIWPFVVIACIAFWWGMWKWLPGPIGSRDNMAMFFDFRSRHPLGGASPVFPLFIAINGLIVVLLSRLCLFNFSPSMAPRVPGQVPPCLHCPGPNAIWEIGRLLMWPIPGGNLIQKAKTIHIKIQMFAVIALIVPLVASSLNIVPMMLEEAQIRWILSVVLCIVVVALVWDLALAAILWNRLKAGCLVPLESSPLRRGFNVISGLTWKSLWLMPQTANVQYRAITRSLEQAMRKVMDPWADDAMGGENLREAAEKMWLAHTNGQEQEAVVSFGVVQDKIACMAKSVLLRLQELWRDEVELVTLPDQYDKTPSAVAEQSDSSKLRSILEEWVALIYVHYIRLILVQIRTRLATAAMLYILTVWAVTSYPFINRHALTIGLSGLLAILAAIVISTYASINRDAVLSRTINEKPGRFDIDFLWKTASMVGIPILGLVASQFPEVSSFLFSWIEPGLNTVK
jgi:hypothetical protein